jgi:hypothetical protein
MREIKEYLEFKLGICGKGNSPIKILA